MEFLHQTSIALFLVLALTGLVESTEAACSTAVAVNSSSTLTFQKCVDLGVQGASLSWTLIDQQESSGGGVAVLEVAFRGTATADGGWVGWGLNPGSSPKMVGTSAFIAFNAANGSNLLPYRLTAANTAQGTEALSCSPIDYVVRSSSVKISKLDVTMFLAIELKNNGTQKSPNFVLNHVWNRGPSVTNFQPSPHSFQPNDLKGATQIDMSSGLVDSASSPSSTLEQLKMQHGLINTLAWGILFPSGVMAARYLKTFSTSFWFYVHISFQCFAYFLGVAGWATGMELQSASSGFVYVKHRNIAMLLFGFATLQVMALLLRPTKEHKLRKYWNVYHHSVGYSIVALGIANVFIGFSIFFPGGTSIWPHIYICGLSALGGIAILMEIVTWYIFIRNKHVHISQNKLTINGTFGPTEHVLRVV